MVDWNLRCEDFVPRSVESFFYLFEYILQMFLGVLSMLAA